MIQFFSGYSSLVTAFSFSHNAFKWKLTKAVLRALNVGANTRLKLLDF